MNKYIAIVRKESGGIEKNILEVPTEWNEDPEKWFKTFHLEKGDKLIAFFREDEIKTVVALLV